MKTSIVLCAVVFLVLGGGCSPSGGRLTGIHDDLGDDGGAPGPTDDAGNPIGADDFGVMTHDPATCAEAAMLKSYIGCDYWPTVTANAVWSVFDYAVVISNPGSTAANVTVSGGALAAPKTQMVAPGTLVKIPLPWVAALKGPDANAQGSTTPLASSVKAAKGAYHLVSDLPVLVYQFNALEYKAGTGNNLNGTAWSTCPAASGIPCNSYSNDASLLLPSTAMTKNYIITGIPGDDVTLRPVIGSPTTQASGASYAVITATADATAVTIQLSKTGDILKSTDNVIAAVAQNAASPMKVTYMLDAGDVLELVTDKGSTHDLTGSILQATAPVQVIVGNSCTTNPAQVVDQIFGPAYTCDHVEETVLPVETWGKTYAVTSPTGPDGKLPGHLVRIYGGSNPVALSFTPAVAGAPATLAAGAVVVLDTKTDFVVSGDHEFAVSSEQKSAQIADPANMTQGQRGDPALSFLSAVEQYRDKYLFLAPEDYDVNYVDIVAPTGTTLILDGAAVTTAPVTIGAGYSAIRVPLMAGMSGAHTLTGSAPFGIQIMGYGAQTSYQYPGGLDLKVIGMPPPPIL